MHYDIEALRKDGFLLIEDFLTADESRTLVEGCFRLSEMKSAYEIPKIENFTKKHGSNTISLVNKFDRVPELKAFQESEKIAQLRQAVFGDGSRLHMELLQLSKGGQGQGIAWHRDVAYKFGPMQMCNLLFYPLGTDESKGGIRVIPGSQHKSKSDVELHDPWGAHTEEETFYPGKRDLMILDGATFHAVSKSTSLEDRVSFNIRVRAPMAEKEVTRWAEFTTGSADFVPDADNAVSTG